MNILIGGIMSLYKCKKCGLLINANDDTAVVECEYCGERQTISTKIADLELKAQKYNEAQKLIQLNTYFGYSEAATILSSISDYKDSESLKCVCQERAEVCRKNDVYKLACSHMQYMNLEGITKAIELFSSIPGWMDSDSKLSECAVRLAGLKDSNSEVKQSKKSFVIICIIGIIILSLLFLIPALLPLFEDIYTNIENSASFKLFNLIKLF